MAFGIGAVMSVNDENTSPPPAAPIGDLDRAKLYVDIWKQTVEVQKHFNDLEWRIRALALTAATFALGASAVAARERTSIGGVSLGAVVLLAGLLLWHAFYFADRYWYHPLLLASVRHGEQLERELRTVLPQVGLTLDISEGSPSKPPILWFWRKEKLHSSDKLLYFYVVGGAVLLLAALLLQIASLIPATSPTSGVNTPQVVCCTASTSPKEPSASSTPTVPSKVAPALTPSSSVETAPNTPAPAAEKTP